MGWAGKKETEEGRRSRKKNRDFIPFLSASMAVGVNSLSSAGMVLPASIFEAEGMGGERERERERGGRGRSTLATSGLGNGGWLRRPRQPWLRHPAARGELAGGSERESRGLGLVEEGVGTLTVKPIELWWPGYGDRRVLCSVQKQRRVKLAWRRRRAAELWQSWAARLGELGMGDGDGERAGGYL